MRIPPPLVIPTSTLLSFRPKGGIRCLTRIFPKGKFELLHLGGMTLGRATYDPGWKWSEHVGAQTGAKYCQVEHVGLVLSGRATAAIEDGRVIEMRPGDAFYIAPGHDSWVVGDEPYVSLHFLGAEQYAAARNENSEATKKNGATGVPARPPNRL